MLTTACLQKNTNLYHKLKDIVEGMIWDGLKENDTIPKQRSAVHLDTIWRTLRSNGVEIDLATVGDIYNEVSPKAEPAVMKPKSVEAFAMKQYNRSLRRIAMMVPGQGKTNVSRTGEQASEHKLVTSMMNMLLHAYAPETTKPTMLKDMENITWKAVQRLLNVPEKDRPKNDEEWTDILVRVLGYDKLGKKDINGQINNLQTLYNTMRDVLEETKGRLADEIKKKNGDPATLQKLNDMIDGMNANAMTLFFSRGDANNFLTDMFKREGFGKTIGTGANQKTIIDWNKLAGTTASIADLRGHVQDIMDANGYSQDVIDAVKDSFTNEFNDLHGKIWDKQINGTKAIASAGANALMQDKDAQAFLQGMDFKDWLKQNNVESLQQLDTAIDRQLATMKYLQPVKDKIKEILKERFFDRAYAKLNNNVARQTLKDIGIDAPNPRLTKATVAQTTINKASTDPAVIANLRQLSGETDLKKIAEAYDDAKANGQNQQLVDAVDKLMAAQKQLESPLQWMKREGITNTYKLKQALDQKLAGMNISGALKNDIRKELERILDVSGRTERELARRQADKTKALGRRQTEIRLTKSDIDRLVEMNNLGVFQKGYESLVHDMLGVSNLKRQDLDDIEGIAQGMSALYDSMRDNLNLLNPNLGMKAGLFAGHAMQEMQARLNNIIARNVNDKSTTLKALSYFKKAGDMMLTGLLAGWRSLVRNFTGNSIETAVAALAGGAKGFNLSKEELKRNFTLAAAVIADIVQNGEAYGNSVSDFSPSLHFLDTIKIPENIKDVKELIKPWKAFMLATYGTAKLGLSGIDSVNMAMGHNMHFNHMALESLMGPGQMTKADALQTMNEAFHGQSLKDARAMARKILGDMEAALPANLQRPITWARVERFSNDIINTNLVSNGGLTADMVMAANNSAYHTASYGVGHAPNNGLSRIIGNSREKFRREEKRLIREKNWDALASLRTKNMLLETFGLRFMGGATNWLYMQWQKMTPATALTTLALRRGRPALSRALDKTSLNPDIYTWALGDPNKQKINFDNPKEMQRTLSLMGEQRSRMTRGVVGTTVNVAGYLLLGVLFAGAYGSDDDKDKYAKLLKQIEEDKAAKESTRRAKYKSMLGSDIADEELEAKKLKIATNWMEHIRNDPSAYKAFSVMAPDDMLLKFYTDAYDDAPGKVMGALKWAQQTTGMKYELSTTVANVLALMRQHDYDAASGAAGQWAGNQLAVPGWKTFSDNVYQPVKSIVTGKASTEADFVKPTTFSEGFFAGGAFEEFGLYKANPKITLMSGIGAKGYEKFKAAGITTMEDLRKNPGWEETKDDNGDYILDSRDRKIAKDGYDHYAKQKWGDNPK